MFRHTLSRRRFLIGGSAATLLAACSRGKSDARRSSPVRPRTAAQLLASPLFYVAHRGSGDTWTEHSLDAYQRSVKAGAHAVEISVCATKDGVLVCHHDASAQRLIGVDRDIADMTWRELSELQLDAREWLGPKAPTQPVSRLEDVLASLGDDVLALVEDKLGKNTKALLDMLDEQPRSTARFVWKQWAPASERRAAAERGYLTWGYLTPEIVDRVQEFADRFDALGVPTGTNDAGIARAVATGKPVIAWEVHDRSSRDRLQKLGVTGMMCSNIPYLLHEKRQSTHDAFATGVRSVGDLPAVVDQGWGSQPLIEPQGESVRFEKDGRTSYLMGSMCPLQPEPYRISFRMRWPDALPNNDDHGGVAFALDSDAPYVAKQKSATAGYHAIVRSSGKMEIFERDVDVVDGISLGSVKTGAAKPGEWIELDLLVDQNRIILTRAGDPEWVVTVDDNRHRGGYFRLGKNYEASTALEFTSVSVGAA